MSVTTRGFVRAVLCLTIVATVMIPALAMASGGTSVSGIISADSTWTASDSPYSLTGRVQVAYGCTLTVEPGVTVIGTDQTIQTFGTLRALGTTDRRVIFNRVNLVLGADTPSEPQTLVLRGCQFIAGGVGTGGYLQGRGAVSIYDSLFQDSDVFLRYPTGDCYLERNTFVHGGISAGTNSRIVIQRNLIYHPKRPIENWASYGFREDGMKVTHNTFMLGEGYLGSVLGLRYGDSGMDGTNNYWSGIPDSAINGLILDQSDDVSLGGFIAWEPALTQADPGAPVFSRDILPIPSLTLAPSGPSTLARGSWLEFQCFASSAAGPVSGALNLERSQDGLTWTLVETMRDTGLVRVAPMTNTRYRLSLTDDSDYADAVSNTVEVTVATVALTTKSSASLAYGSAFVVKGTLKASSVGLAGQRVILQVGTSATSIKDSRLVVTTGTGGAFSFTVKPTTKAYYRVRFAGAGGYAPTTPLAYIYALPRTSLGNPVAPATMSHAKAYSLYGYLKPRHTAGTYPVRIYKERYVSGKWKSYSYVNAKASNYSSYTKYASSVRLPYAGKWRVRAYSPADAGHTATWSSGYDYVLVK